MMSVDVREGAKPVVLHFVDEIRVIEGLRNAQQRYRRDEREHAFMVSIRTAEIQLNRS